jgi:hypothetical protein
MKKNEPYFCRPYRRRSDGVNDFVKVDDLTEEIHFAFSLVWKAFMRE